MRAGLCIRDGLRSRAETAGQGGKHACQEARATASSRARLWYARHARSRATYDDSIARVHNATVHERCAKWWCAHARACALT
mmetsp:Transcript_20748/g.64492  ORF Transcript_20748/g.64492 Transcript_20748/m.64492 type:complete len:82 (+) Transcript_20748:128-373(+)